MKFQKFSGLSETEAKKKLDVYGYNEIKDTGKASPIKILFRQIKHNFIVYFLLAAMVLSFFVGKSITAYVILVVILAVIITGFIQEYKAEKAIEKLKKMVMSVSIVIRDGEEKEISTKGVVPGDILVLRTGEKIPADCVVLSEKNLLVNEAVLTGEADEVRKSPVDDVNTPEKENTLYAGSFIVDGKCLAQVTHTGMNTKFGKIASLISSSQKALPLQEKVNKISKYMALIGITMAILTGVAVLFQSTPTPELFVELLILTIAIAVSAFPEGFPVVLITTLSAGAHKMAKKNAIVNRMSIIETLGETTIICSDKTGTITKGEMTVKEIYANGKTIDVSGVGYIGEGDFTHKGKKINPQRDENLKLLLKTAVVCNDARIKRTGEDMVFQVMGSPTEAALLVMASKAEVFQEDFNPRIDEIPFSSETKMMSVMVEEGKQTMVYSKGALEILLDKCAYLQKGNKVSELTKKEKNKILKQKAKMASNSLRTLGLAYRKAKSSKIEEMEKDLIFLGLVGIEDPPREGIRGAISSCKKAGIKIKMITGDDKKTALSIAKQIDLEYGKVLEGTEIDELTDNELSKIVNQVTIFARVRPEHKLRIVRALKERGEIVTMTGDGVNDAPALKEAHIGVAMGKNGTDVSRSVADLTLKDDNFVTMVDAIKEGRTIFNNIRKFVSYQLSCNTSELMILFIGVLLVPFFGWPIPLLLALQILFMNIVTDNLPAITLGLNHSSEDIMREKPRRKAPILNKHLFMLLIASGAIMALFVLVTFYFAFNVLGQAADNARTTALLTLICLEIAGAFNFRSFRKPALTRSPFVNPFLAVASALSVIATILIIYTPLNQVFQTVPLTLVDWVIGAGFGLLLMLIFDIFKRINNNTKRFDFYH